MEKYNTQLLLILCPFSNCWISLNSLSLYFTLSFTTNANLYWPTIELRKNKWKCKIRKNGKRNYKWEIVKQKVKERDRIVVKEKELDNKKENRSLLLEVQ